MRSRSALCAILVSFCFVWGVAAMPPATEHEVSGRRRPWLMIVFLGVVSLYLLYAVGTSVWYLVQHDVPSEKMTAYIPGLLIALVCGAASIGLYFGHGWAGAFGKWTRGGAGALVGSETPAWISVALLLLAWTANAFGSAVLWALSIGNPVVGYSFIVTNLIGIVMSAWLFLSGRRSLAIKCVVWVIPLTLLAWFAIASVSGFMQAG